VSIILLFGARFVESDKIASITLVLQELTLENAEYSN
jgi:hypothetical protein